MPVFEGWDYPAVEWCSVRQAIGWIRSRAVPLSVFHANILHGGASIAASRQDEDASSKLIHQIAYGCLTLRGKPGIGPIEIESEGSRFDVWCRKWAPPEPIAPVRVTRLGHTARQTFLAGGNLYGTDGPYPGTVDWVFTSLEVDFAQLMERYPPPDGAVVRIGEDVVRVSAPDAQLVGAPVAHPAELGPPPGDEVKDVQPRSAGNTPYDDTALIERALALLRNSAAKSDREAAKIVVAEAMEKNGNRIVGASVEAWETRVRKKVSAARDIG